MRTKLVYRNGKVIELKENEVEEVEGPKVFSIGGRSGFKWSKRSNNKTWIENGKVVRDRKGKRLKE
tara:strand:+ start:301 stop:498 length:198 start_codon:yes stop_codon:yes gene_type:complete